MKLLRIFSLLLLLTLLSLSFSQEIYNPHVFPRPMITIGSRENHGVDSIEELNLQCTSWRFAVESDNLGPWKTIPQECVDYVKEYVMGRGYAMDLERVSNEASFFARSFALTTTPPDATKDAAWVFDVDETLLSNLPYYSQHAYGMEPFDSVAFDEWVEQGMAPAIPPSLELYQEVMNLGFKIFLLTGRSERHRGITIQNLVQAGFHDWDKLILRGAEEHDKLAKAYKSEQRNKMVEEEGYRIIGNSGDQWSDLLGSSMSNRSFKLPNPMYYIP